MQLSSPSALSMQRVSLSLCASAQRPRRLSYPASPRDINTIKTSAMRINRIFIELSEGATYTGAANGTTLCSTRRTNVCARAFCTVGKVVVNGDASRELEIGCDAVLLVLCRACSVYYI